jgi:hypothetical protein
MPTIRQRLLIFASALLLAAVAHTAGARPESGTSSLFCYATAGNPRVLYYTGVMPYWWDKYSRTDTEKIKREFAAHLRQAYGANAAADLMTCHDSDNAAADLERYAALNRGQQRNVVTTGWTGASGGGNARAPTPPQPRVISGGSTVQPSPLPAPADPDADLNSAQRLNAQVLAKDNAIKARNQAALAEFRRKQAEYEAAQAKHSADQAAYQTKLASVQEAQNRYQRERAAWEAQVACQAGDRSKCAPATTAAACRREPPQSGLQNSSWDSSQQAAEASLRGLVKQNCSYKDFSLSELNCQSRQAPHPVTRVARTVWQCTARFQCSEGREVCPTGSGGATRQ